MAERWLLRVPDRRRIQIIEYGDPAGRPLLLLHGTPLSASAYRWFVHEPARARGLRVLCPNRAGIGFSDPMPGRDLGAWADDAAALADALGVDALPMVGHSCGGPFALAAAARLPRLVPVVALVGAAGPARGTSRSGGRMSAILDTVTG